MAVDMSGLLDSIETRASEVFDAASAAIVAKKIADCPIGETGDMAQSIDATPASGGAGNLTCDLHVDVDYASYTDEGTEAHDIPGNPWIAFEGADGTVIRNTDLSGPIRWVPGAGVAANIGWFSRTLQDDWTEAVSDAVNT